MIQLNIKQILQNKGKTAYWLAKKQEYRQII